MKFVIIFLISVFILVSCGKKSDPEYKANLITKVENNFLF